jgi:hypothetical protein
MSQAMAAALASLSRVSGDTLAVSGDGAEVVLEQAAVKELSESLRGRLLLPGQEGYDVARRVMNAGIDRHPALIVQPSGAADIMSAVTFARERELLLAVKCGGHSFGGKSTCNGGMQIDLSTMRSARIDPFSRTAYIGGGSHLGELDHESMALGLVTPAGTVSHTGVGGLSLGGGWRAVTDWRWIISNPSISSRPMASCGAPAPRKTRISIGEFVEVEEISVSSPRSNSSFIRCSATSLAATSCFHCHSCGMY